MSAIWGMISEQKKENFLSIASAMKERMESYKIDRIDQLQMDDVFFACGHQYLTQEACQEVLPFFDAETDTFFTADCILDNREELIEQFSAGLKQDECVTDSHLSWLAWLKWGEDFVTHLRGIFSFAVYDRSKDLFLLYADHMSGRAINYSITKEDGIWFSTTYDLFHVAFPHEELLVSEKWIVACEGKPSPCMILFPGLTPYENVYQVIAGQYLRVEKGKASVHTYWNPLNTPELHLPDHETYGKLFRSTFTQCVRDLLRPGVKVAAQLSSGLDSTAVVSVAAPILAERGEALNTYTSVPDPDAPLKTGSYQVPDESAGVRKTVEYFPNVNCHFVSAKGISPLTNLEDSVHFYDFPLKSAINLPWIEGINQEARQAGCTVMLIGQHGNSTISAGEVLALTYHQLMHFHLIRAYRTARTFTRRNKISFKLFIRNFTEEWYRNHIYPGFLFTDSGFRDSYIRKELLRHHHIIQETGRRNHCEGGSMEFTRKQMHQAAYRLNELQQIGMYSTVQSLLSGIIERDPTKDPRIVELCISFPMDEFVVNGTERYLVRGQMAGIVPDHIRLDIWHRGKQGADFIYRINRNWKEEREIALRCLQVSSLKEYLEPEKLDEMIVKCRNTESFLEEDELFLMNVLYFSALGCFLSRN